MATTKKNKNKAYITIRLPLEMQRHTQRAHTFQDRKKKAAKNACRGRRWD
jgi:hypothetical protein